MRRSDRWMTPGVVVVLILAGTVVCLGVLAAVTYLTARGFDPQPVVQLAGTLVAAVAGVGTFVQNLVTRKTTAKVEREVGRLGTGVVQVVDELDQVRGRHTAPPAEPGDQDPAQDPAEAVTLIPGRAPLPAPPTAPHPLYGRSAAPGPQRS